MAQDAKRSFVLYYDYRQHLALLTDEERGRLLMALLDYGENGSEPNLEGAAMMAFSFICSQMDRDATKYAEICRKRREAGRQGGRPTKANDETEKQTEAKKANAFEEKQTEAKKPDTDNDTDNGTDNDTDNDINIPPLPPKGEKPPQEEKRTDVQEQRFSEFWKAYPKKVGKKAAFASWKKVKPDCELFDRIMQAVTNAKKSKEWTKEGGQYIPNPTTWLNQGRWDDVLTPADNTDRQKGAQSNGDYIGNAERKERRENTGGETVLTGFRMAY